MPREVLEDVGAVARSAQDAVALQRQAVEVLASAVPFDRWCGLVLDPATYFATGGYHAEGVPTELFPRLLEIEAAAEDVNLMPQLAASRTGVSTIDRATSGEPHSSARYRDVLAPAGLGRELRTVLRDRESTWGGIVLLRETGSRDFSDEELRLVARCSEVMARGVRRCLLMSELTHRDAVHVPGMAVLTIEDGSVAVELATAAARSWLEAIEDGPVGGSAIPVAAASLAIRALTTPGLPTATKLRTRDGRWLTLHAEVLDPGSPAKVSLVVEPTRPHELAEVIAMAYGLTAREREVARRMVAGQSAKEVAAALWLSQWTVQDHVKSIYAKLDVHSRAELGARMFFDQYVPRVANDDAVGADGFFIPVRPDPQAT